MKTGCTRRRANFVQRNVMNFLVRKVLVVIALLYSGSLVLAADCPNAPTYEGVVTLSDGASACSALGPAETDADKGKHFVTCSNGQLIQKDCTFGLSYDIVAHGCTWGPIASCSHSAPATAGNPGGTAAPTAPVGTPFPKEECGPTNCKLPNCFCYGASYPGIVQGMPQFIMLTFDDGVTDALYEQFYRPLFIDNTYNLLNPNGCKVKTALYVINENTDYTKVKSLASVGNEVASHTIHHILAQGDKASDYANISAEMRGMRDEIFSNTGDQALADSVVGFRAPYLRVAGDVMFQALLDNTFLYDTSIVNVETSSGRSPLWPYTFDFPVKSCVNPPCPTKPFRGLWEVPLNSWLGDDGYSCGMIDGCIVGKDVFLATEQEYYNYYERNFHDHFYTNKVPMHMFTHASMFLRSPSSFPALWSWLQDTLSTKKDVWLVSPRQVIEWMQMPFNNTEMIAQKWGCD